MERREFLLRYVIGHPGSPTRVWTYWLVGGLICLPLVVPIALSTKHHHALGYTLILVLALGVSLLTFRLVDWMYRVVANRLPSDGQE